MNPDDLSMFSPLSIDPSLNTYDSLFNATGAPSGQTTTTAAPPSVNPSATGAAPSAGISGFQAVLNTLTGAFTGGIAAYNTVAQNTGLPLANGTPTTPLATVAPAPVVFAGMTQNQLFLVGGGIGVIALLLILKKR